MSEASIQKKLSKSYKKAGKILGRNFHVFRPVALNDSLSPANFIFDQYAALTLTEKFTTPQSESFKHYIVYTDYLNLRVGDILHDDTETFVLVWSRGIEDPLAIRTTDLVEIYSTGWSTTDGLQQTRTRIAKNVPATVTKLSSTDDIRVTNVQNASQANRWEVRIWSATDEIKQTDNIVFADGTILLINSITTNEMVQVFQCTEVKA